MGIKTYTLYLVSSANEQVTWTYPPCYTLEEVFSVVASSIHCSEQYHLVAINGRKATDRQIALWQAYAGTWQLVQEMKSIR